MDKLIIREYCFRGKPLRVTLLSFSSSGKAIMKPILKTYRELKVSVIEQESYPGLFTVSLSSSSKSCRAINLHSKGENCLQLLDDDSGKEIRIQVNWETGLIELLESSISEGKQDW